jgi:hypothetical protein
MYQTYYQPSVASGKKLINRVYDGRQPEADQDNLRPGFNGGVRLKNTDQ